MEIFVGQSYWWVDGIHTGLRSEQSGGQCLLVIIRVTADRRTERVVIGDGYRESKQSWAEILLDLKARSLRNGSLMAIGDGAMGFWAALEVTTHVPRPGIQAYGGSRKNLAPNSRC